jgi:hypothetical protein
MTRFKLSLVFLNIRHLMTGGSRANDVPQSLFCRKMNSQQQGRFVGPVGPEKANGVQGRAYVLLFHPHSVRLRLDQRNIYYSRVLA